MHEKRSLKILRSLKFASSGRENSEKSQEILLLIISPNHLLGMFEGMDIEEDLQPFVCCMIFISWNRAIIVLPVSVLLLNKGWQAISYISYILVKNS